jgi:hypothetical protein
MTSRVAAWAASATADQHGGIGGNGGFSGSPFGTGGDGGTTRGDATIADGGPGGSVWKCRLSKRRHRW